MIISDKQVMRLIRYAENYLEVCKFDIKYNLANEIDYLLNEITDQQSTDLKDVK